LEKKEEMLLICCSSVTHCKMGFPCFGGTSGLVGMRLVRQYQDKKRLKGKSMYAEVGERYRTKLNSFLAK